MHENCQNWNLPGCEDFRAAHGMAQVAHRAIFGIVLPGQFDMKSVNRQNQPQKTQDEADAIFPFRNSNWGMLRGHCSDSVKTFDRLRNLQKPVLQTKKMLLLRAVCNCRISMFDSDRLPPWIYCNVEKPERRAVIGPKNWHAWHVDRWNWLITVFYGMLRLCPAGGA